MSQVDVCGFQLASKTPFRSAFEAVQLLTKVQPSDEYSEKQNMFLFLKKTWITVIVKIVLSSLIHNY